MSEPIVKTKNTKSSGNMGVYGRKRSAGAGKGDIIASTFGSGWLKNTEDRLSKRMYACSDAECGKLKPSGKCEFCGHEPSGNKGW